MEQRIEFCLKALRSGNFRELCREYAISTKTGYKWRERFLRLGSEGMEEESRRPRSHPESVGEQELCAIIRLKQAHMGWGPRKIRELYYRRHGRAASESTFKRLLDQSGLTQKVKRRPAKESGRLCSGRKAQGPNEVWTIDFKGWWWNGIERCEPLTVRDEFSRYVLEVRALDNARGSTVQKSLERLFERHGLPAAMRSDNGAPFASDQAVHGLSRLSAWWVALGIDLERGRPAHPQDNGAHERLHRDISLQLESHGHSDQDSLDLWRQEFNELRPHEALGMRCPSELYENSPRKYQSEVAQELDYGQMATRRINQNGRLKWHNHELFVSSSLGGWSVGLQVDAQQHIEVWFARLLLGWIEPEAKIFIRADIRPNKNQKETKKETLESVTLKD